MKKQKQEKPTEKSEKQRRSRGEGTVLQRADGRWVARIPLGDGKRKEEYYDTKKEAEQGKRRMLNEKDSGKLLTGPDQTFGDYLQYWLNAHGATIRITSHSMYHAYIRARLIPALGHIMLKKLSPNTFQSLYQSWEDELSPNTIRLIHTIAMMALGDAVLWKKLSSNPADHVKLPKARKAIIHVLSDEEITALLQYAVQSRWYLLFYMALLIGMREGELIGLKWSDIHLDEAILHVQRTVSYVRNPATGRFGFVEGPPKTEAGVRSICLPVDMVDLLRNHYQQQLELRQAARQWKDLNLVFCTGGGNYLFVRYLREQFDKLLKNAGLEHMKFHTLRHNASMILRRLGIDSVVRKEMLGHSSILMTDDVYGHATPKMHRDAAKEMNRLFNEKKE